MVVDYSKWDNIELSDDSDVEVHPNVDKKSFIRWKQQSIHEKRQQRNQDIKNLEMQLTMYENLNKRVDKLIKLLPSDQYNSLSEITKFLNANFDKLEKCTGDNVDPDIGTYNEMVEDLFEQLDRDIVKDGKDPKDNHVIKEYLLNHRAKIDKVSNEAKEKLSELYKEKHAHISSEDIHTGFDSSFMNKKSVEEDTKNVKDAIKKLEIEQNKDKDSLGFTLPTMPLEFISYDGDDFTKLHELTEKFGLINYNDYVKSEKYLLNHMNILSEQQKDALMMKAFEYQLKDPNSKLTYQIIHQSELMSYIRELYDLKKIPFLNENELKNCIEMFFQKIIYNNQNIRGKESFLQSVKAKYDHVLKRCQIIKEEEEQQQQNGEQSLENSEGVETIQLKSLDDSTELEVTLPNFNSTDPTEIAKCKAFNELPVPMQNALKTQNLDEVNKVFATMSVDEAEKILELFDKAEIIGVKALLENEDDFNQIKQEYQLQNNESSQDENITADIVD